VVCRPSSRPEAWPLEQYLQERMHEAEKLVNAGRADQATSLMQRISTLCPS